MQRYGITLQQLKDAVASSNSNVGGQYIVQGGAPTWSAAGAIGRARTPWTAMGMQDPVPRGIICGPRKQRRIREIRQIVLSAPTTCRCGWTTWSKAARSRPSIAAGRRGVVVGHQTRLGRVMPAFRCTKPRAGSLRRPGNRRWHDETTSSRASC